MREGYVILDNPTVQRTQIGFEKWSDVSVQHIRAIDFVLHGLHLKEQIVKIIDQTIPQTIVYRVSQIREQFRKRFQLDHMLPASR